MQSTYHLAWGVILNFLINYTPTCETCIIKSDMKTVNMVYAQFVHSHWGTRGWRVQLVYAKHLSLSVGGYFAQKEI